MLQNTVFAVHQIPLNFEVTKSVRIELTRHVLLSEESKHKYRVLIGTIPLFCYIVTIYYVSKKVKQCCLQGWSGPEGSRKLRFPDFVTTAQDGGKVVSLTHRPPLPPGIAPGIHFC